MRQLAATLLLLTLAAPAAATPPEYRSFHREQRIDHAPVDADLLRIWMVYVGQGDGLLIQLPRTYDYERDTDDGPRTERLDVMVDGGAWINDDSLEMIQVIQALYPEGAPVIEHAVISHHDKDHVKGLEFVLEDEDIGVENIWHNGLVSWNGGTHGFPLAPTSGLDLIYEKNSAGQIGRAMAFYGADGALQSSALMGGLTQLAGAVSHLELDNVYKSLAEAVVEKTEPEKVRTFNRAFVGSPFIGEREAELGRSEDFDGLEFQVLWPREELHRYTGSGSPWSYTINGNSLSFVLRYGDFSMFFTGDMNDASEAAFLDSTDGDLWRDCDVMKVPHHGSSHQDERFFRLDGDDRGPVIAVCSQGEKGFRSNWQHPSPEVVKWLGGAHRVYHTHVHERRFLYPDDGGDVPLEDLEERRHILLETDGTWFRVVEVELTDEDVQDPPGVRSVRRGNGTRWIKAS